MINKKVVELEQRIIDLINEANMPPAVVSLVLNKILRNVDDLAIQMINKEIAEAKEQEKTAENE